MSSEVETSRVAILQQVPRDSSTSLGMTIFAALEVYLDNAARSAAMNMAIDEALLECAKFPSIRFYQWHSPALSFGYFGKLRDVARYASERDLVRRWTGGGIVFHGDDLTYSIVIPANDSAFSESSISIYEKVHCALCEALGAVGRGAKLSASAALYGRKSRKGDLQTPNAFGVENRRSLDSAVIDCRYNDCFANPVRADVMIDGRKIAGAAQRRTRHGLLQQGSIQGVELESRFAERFAQALSVNCSEREVDRRILERGRELVQHKYGTDAWLRKR